MTRDETVNLLRIQWGLTGKRFNDDVVELWHEVLADLDYDTARAAMIKLCSTDKHFAFADFFGAVKASDRPTEHHGPRCERCDGTGWVEAPPEVAHDPRACTGNPCYCHAVVPCACSAGHRVRTPTNEPAPPPFVMTDEQREINARGHAMVAEILAVQNRATQPELVDQIIRKWMPNADLEDQ